jgi:hypothetical protein
LPSSLPKPIRKLKDQDQRKSHLIGSREVAESLKKKIAGRDPKTNQLLKTVTAGLKKTENVTAEVTNFRRRAKSEQGCPLSQN